MAKERIVLDLEQGLKDRFQERLGMVNDRFKMTGVLRLAIYSMLMMDNGELRSFLKGASVDGSSFKSYTKLFEDAEKEGIIPEDMPMINPRIRDCMTVLSNHERDKQEGKEDRDEVTEKLRRIWQESYWDTPEGIKEKLDVDWQ